jgi:hypothetical protein
VLGLCFTNLKKKENKSLCNVVDKDSVASISKVLKNGSINRGLSSNFSSISEVSLHSQLGGQSNIL